MNAVRGQAAGCLGIRPSRSLGSRFRNTAELSGELSMGDLVAVGEVLLIIERVGWAPFRGAIRESRVGEPGSVRLPPP